MSLKENITVSSITIKLTDMIYIHIFIDLACLLGYETINDYDHSKVNA